MEDQGEQERERRKDRERHKDAATHGEGVTKGPIHRQDPHYDGALCHSEASPCRIIPLRCSLFLKKTPSDSI